MTIEAALAVPIFFFAAVCIIYLMEVRTIGLTVHAAALHAAKICTEDAAIVPVLNTVRLKSEIVNFIGREKLNQSMILGGSGGLHCGLSYISPATGEMNIRIQYKVQLPIPGFIHVAANQEEILKMSSWNGYMNEKAADEGEIVYITENGSVYHEDYQCTYLQLSIRFVPYSELSKIRNDDGGKYYQCEKCVQGEAMAGVYITEQGTRYHNSIGCSGLKRTVYAVQKSQIWGKGGCSRCTK